MKLKRIEAYVEVHKSREKSIFVQSSDDGHLWIKINIESSKDSEHLVDMDYWNIRELGKTGDALEKLFVNK
jgi:hypothetical protein